ncbi:MAG: hypothetical protein P4M11_02695 [Candidatus Pacebacteria bacterium]|nr:hypothetical protein [Candidatus Paceibacterota bacterium]
MKNVTLNKKQFEALREDKNFYRKALTFFQKFCGTIEIVRNTQSEIVHFPILPYAEALTEQQRRETVSGMPIGQAKAKLDYFMGGCMGTLQTMKNEYLFAKTFRVYPGFGAVAKHLSLWSTLAFYTVPLSYEISRRS